MDLAVFYAFGVALVAVGIIIIVVAIILASVRGAEKGKGKVRAAGVIMIGPIPIIFGTDKKMIKSVLTLALALTITLVVAMVIYYWLFR